MNCDVGKAAEGLENELWCEAEPHSPNLTLLHLRHSSFSNPSTALPTSQFILQPIRCFTYITVHSPTLLSLLLRHKLFTSFTWRAAHGTNRALVSNSVIASGRILKCALIKLKYLCNVSLLNSTLLVNPELKLCHLNSVVKTGTFNIFKLVWYTVCMAHTKITKYATTPKICYYIHYKN